MRFWVSYCVCVSVCSSVRPCVQAHCHFVVVKLFAAKLSELSNTAVYSVLSTLALLYALHGVAKNSGDFLQVRHTFYKPCNVFLNKTLVTLTD